jgi:hypothetical protein
VFVNRTEPPEHLDVLGYKALVLDADNLPAVTQSFVTAGVEMV